MDQITQQVNRARRRIILQKFLNQLAWWLFGTLSVAAIAILVPKLRPIEIEASFWNNSCLVGAVALAIVGALLTTWLRATGAQDAAAEVDQRYGLKERLSSLMGLSPDERESAAGQALLADAIHKAERIDIRDQFPLRGNWLNCLPVVPALIAFALIVFVPAATQEKNAAQASAVAAKQPVKNTTDQLKKKLAERKKMAQEEGLKPAVDAFDELEKGVEELRKTKDIDQKKALVKLNNLADQLAQRRRSLGDSQKLKEKLNQLKNTKAGPADKLAKAMKKGNFNSAMKELSQLKNKMMAGQLSEKQQKQLAQQLKQLGEKMQQLADAQQEAKDALKQEIQKQREAGNLSKAAELQNKLDKLAAQDANMKKLAEMAKQMAKASKNLDQKELAKAAKAMSEMAENMTELKSALEQMELLDEAMEQLANAKNSMMCQACQGEGCSMCQGGMSALMAMGRGRSRGMGMGMGEGRGVGDRPEAQTNKNFYDSRVRAKVGKGRAVVTGLASGPNLPGEALQEINTSLQSATEKGSEDPLSGNRLPKDVRDHVRDYFEKRGGDQ